VFNQPITPQRESKHAPSRLGRQPIATSRLFQQERLHTAQLLYQGSAYIEVSIDPSHGFEVRGAIELATYIPSNNGIDSIYCFVLFSWGQHVGITPACMQVDRVVAQQIALYLLQGVKHGIMSCTS
jgi:hypothetical protein